MKAVNPYLNFVGNTEEAFNFYKSVFGGDFIMIQRMSDTPDASRLPENEKNKIMHISLPLGKDNVLMGTDTLESMGHKLTMGNNFHISIHTDSEDETNRLFAALSKGGTVMVEPAKMFWGDYFGMCTDKFGVQWMLNFSPARH